MTDNFNKTIFKTLQVLIPGSIPDLLFHFDEK